MADLRWCLPVDCQAGDCQAGDCQAGEITGRTASHTMRRRRWLQVLTGTAGLLVHPRLAAGEHAPAPPVTAVSYSPDGRWLLVGDSAVGWLLDRVGGERRPLPVEGRVHAWAFSPSGRWVAAAGGQPGEHGRLGVWEWEAATGAMRLHRQVLAAHSDTVESVCWETSDAGREGGLVTASLDRTLKRWSWPDLEPLAVWEGHSRGVTSVVSLPGGQLVSGALDHSLRVWSRSGQLVRTMNQHTGPVHRLAVRPGSPRLPQVASVGGDGTVRFWQPTIGRLMRFLRLENAVPLAVAWLPGGQQVLVAGTDGKLRVLLADTLEIVAETSGGQGWLYAVAGHPTLLRGVAGGAAGGLVEVAGRAGP